jgi:hypothetical protein
MIFLSLSGQIPKEYLNEAKTVSFQIPCSSSICKLSFRQSVFWVLTDRKAPPPPCTRPFSSPFIFYLCGYKLILYFPYSLFSLFFNSLFFSSFLTSLSLSIHSLTDMCTGNLPGGKARPADNADNLTAICGSTI